MNNINRPNSWSGSAMHGVNQNQYDQIPAEFRADRISYDDLEVPSPSRYPFPLKSESDKSQEKQKKDKINQNYYDQIPAEFRAHRISHDDLEVPSPSRYSFPLKSESEKSPEKQKKEKIKKPRDIAKALDVSELHVALNSIDQEAEIIEKPIVHVISEVANQEKTFGSFVGSGFFSDIIISAGGKYVKGTETQVRALLSEWIALDLLPVSQLIQDENVSGLPLIGGEAR
ncbi:hypothetical protein QYM36_001706 [Artemia franciscana]|uniref:Uncharacterized protein n=1 Tax=Artemia franciscana TaxID=6661 RepID=A0AA88IPF4_ARTSF|nr:hypothetical protein QYM36_001706 [Artemia franciscana]